MLIYKRLASSLFLYSFSEAHPDNLKTPCLVYIFLVENEFKTYIAMSNIEVAY